MRVYRQGHFKGKWAYFRNMRIKLHCSVYCLHCCHFSWTQSPLCCNFRRESGTTKEIVLRRMLIHQFMQADGHILALTYPAPVAYLDLENGWGGREREREARERSTHITFLVPLPDKALPFSKTKWWGEGRWGCWSPPLDLSLASCPIKPPNNCASWLKQTARTITMIRTNWTGWGRL